VRLTLKQFAVKALLAILRGFVLVKRHIGPMSRAVVAPFLALGRFLVSIVGVPVYRLVFWIRRSSSRFLMPAKNRAVYFVTNRYAIHAAVIGVAAATSVLNMNDRVVHAETFASHSMLFALVAGSDQNAIEEVFASDDDPTVASSPFHDGIVDSSFHMDMDFADASYVTTATGDGAISTPIVSDNADSLAPRTEVEKYVVQDGDVLGAISEKYGLSLSSLLWANGLSFRSTIRPGQELTIPPIDGVLYTVKKGDTINKIASTYDSDTEKILAFNSLASADSLTVGAQIMIPDGQPPAPPAAPRTAPLTSLFTPSYSGTSSTDTGSVHFIWPTEGYVITQYFGHLESWGSPHTGLDIDGNYKTHSFAAADGVVIFSGWRNGYGNCVEIDHGNGYVTRYAHHSKNVVSKGDVVTAGQIIANTGTTGWSSGTHLHFEVIKNGKFKNPLDYLR
jgi:murein DD-endopeptidase MepM/ murein hydrolase activator NlpD